jgi:hypothetical protein
MIGAARGEHRDRHAVGSVRQEGDLMIDEPCARAPAALEVQPPAVWANLPDPPALSGDDRRQQPHRGGAMARDDVGIEVQEEARLVGRVDAACTP